MTTREKVELCVAVLALVGVAFLVSEYVQEREGRARMEERLSAEHRVQAEIDKREDARHKALDNDLDQIRRETRAAQTPEQIAPVLRQVAQLPEPITIAPPPAGAPPDAPSQLLLTQPNAVALWQYVGACRETEKKLAACSGDLADEKLRLESVTREKDKAVKTARGGGFWSRTWHDSKKVGIGVGVGVALGIALSKR
jgi:hypothetical protein